MIHMKKNQIYLEYHVKIHDEKSSQKSLLEIWAQLSILGKQNISAFL